MQTKDSSFRPFKSHIKAFIIYRLLRKCLKSVSDNVITLKSLIIQVESSEICCSKFKAAILFVRFWKIWEQMEILFYKKNQFEKHKILISNLRHNQSKINHYYTKFIKT